MLGQHCADLKCDANQGESVQRFVTLYCTNVIVILYKVRLMIRQECCDVQMWSIIMYRCVCSNVPNVQYCAAAELSTLCIWEVYCCSVEDHSIVQEWNVALYISGYCTDIEFSIVQMQSSTLWSVLLHRCLGQCRTDVLHSIVQMRSLVLCRSGASYLTLLERRRAYFTNVERREAQYFSNLERSTVQMCCAVSFK